MRSIFKAFVWFVAIIIMLYIILAFILHYAINPKTYKSLVQSTVYSVTGHEMVINGEFEWGIFPNPSIKVTDVLIKNQDGSQQVSPYFAKVKEADMQIKLLPLFSGKIIPKTIILRGAHINLVYQSAKNNPVSKTTATIQHIKNSPSSATLLTPNSGSASRATYLHSIQLPNVTILNTSINWIDLKQNKITNFNDVNLTIHPNNLYSALIKGSITIIHDKQTVKLNLDTTLTSNQQQNQFTFGNLKCSGTATANNTTNTLSYAGPINIDLVSHALTIPSYTLNWNNLPMSGKITGNWNTDNNRLSATFTASTTVAGGLINEKGQFSAADKQQNSLRYLLSIHNVNMAQILKALHYDNLLKGTGNLTATLSASNANHNWISNLNGNGNFKLTQAELGTLNSTHYLNQAMHVLHSNTVQDTGITVFSNISGSFTIHNGVFYNDDLQMDAIKLTATGSGNINLNNQVINYHVLLKHHDSQGYTIPLDISGELQHPKVKVDLTDLGKDVIQKSVKKNLFKNLFNDKHINIQKIF